jgi:hypothetical protein
VRLSTGGAAPHTTQPPPQRLYVASLPQRKPPTTRRSRPPRLYVASLPQRKPPTTRRSRPPRLYVASLPQRKPPTTRRSRQRPLCFASLKRGAGETPQKTATLLLCDPTLCRQGRREKTLLCHRISRLSPLTSRTIASAKLFLRCKAAGKIEGNGTSSCCCCWPPPTADCDLLQVHRSVAMLQVGGGQQQQQQQHAALRLIIFPPASLCGKTVSRVPVTDRGGTATDREYTPAGHASPACHDHAGVFATADERWSSVPRLPSCAGWLTGRSPGGAGPGSASGVPPAVPGPSPPAFAGPAAPPLASEEQRRRRTAGRLRRPASGPAPNAQKTSQDEKTDAPAKPEQTRNERRNATHTKKNARQKSERPINSRAGASENRHGAPEQTKNANSIDLHQLAVKL